MGSVSCFHRSSVSPGVFRHVASGRGTCYALCMCRCNEINKRRLRQGALMEIHFVSL